MSRTVVSLRRATRMVAAASALALSACATPSAEAPAAPAGGAPFVSGQEASVEGTIARIDTDPWAYDGNAVVVVTTGDGRSVQVELPARWNLCRAEPPGDVQALQAGDRVQAAGTVGESGSLVVCEQPTHHLRRAD